MKSSTPGSPATDWLDAEELLRLALDAAGKDDNEKALTLLKRGLVQAPGDARLLYMLGAQHAQMGLYDRAIDEMHQAVRLDPNLHTAHFQIGLLHFVFGRLEQAETAWLPLETLPESDALRLFKAGLLHMGRDRWQQSADCLRRGIEANTANTPLNGDMTRLLQQVEAHLKTPAAGTNPPGAQAPESSLTAPAHVLLNAYRRDGGRGAE